MLRRAQITVGPAKHTIPISPCSARIVRNRLCDAWSFSALATFPTSSKNGREYTSKFPTPTR